MVGSFTRRSRGVVSPSQRSGSGEKAFPVARKGLGRPPGGLKIPPGGLGVVAKPTWKFERLNRMSRRGWEALPVGLKGMGGP